MDLTTPDGRAELGRRIQQAILESGCDSLPAFAEQHGWSRALIYKYVGGAVLAQLDRLQQIATATGKPLEWFLASVPEQVAAREQELADSTRDARLQAAAAHGELAEARRELLDMQRTARAARVQAGREVCRAIRAGYDAGALLAAAQDLIASARAADDPRTRAAALVQAGHAWLDLGQPAEARTGLEEALGLARQVGDARLAAAARQELVRALQALNRTQDALQQSEELAADSDWWTRWAGLLSWASLLEQVGDYDAASARTDEAEQTLADPEAREEHLPLARTYLAGVRVNLLLGRGRYGEAARLSAQARDLAEQAAAPDQTLEALLSLGLAGLRSGDLAQADRVLAHAHERAAWTDDVRRQTMALSLRAELAARMGQAEPAKRWAHEALRLAVTGQHWLPAAWASLALAMACMADRQPADAQQWLDQSARWARDAGARRLGLEADLWRRRVEIVAGGDASPALAELASEADKLGMQDLAAEARAWAALARLQDEPDPEAVALAERAGDVAREAGAWWVELAARGACALGMSHVDRSRGNAMAEELHTEVLAHAEELGSLAGAVETWPDLYALNVARGPSVDAATTRSNTSNGG